MRGESKANSREIEKGEAEGFVLMTMAWRVYTQINITNTPNTPSPSSPLSTLITYTFQLQLPLVA